MSKPLNPDGLAEFWTCEAPTYEHQRHDMKHYPMQEYRLRYIIEMLGDGPCKHLDVGCGPGYTIIPLLKKGWDITGMDISPEMLERAKKNISDAGLDASQPHFLQGDIEKLPFEDHQFDSLACIGVVEYLREDDKALSELWRVLKPGGTLVISIRNKMCLFRLWDAFIPLRKNIRAMLAKFGLYGGKAYLDKKFRDGIWYKKHAPNAFCRTLAAIGFKKVAQAYFHYYILPAPFEYLLGGKGTQMAVKLEKLHRSSMSMFMASGYIVKVVKSMDA
ncbi:MAG: class I SAM-dependent methyltransferase [Spartobacteria bacterium]|nr:class I SAM-dependent methyltransferase [Spartobacteria bacterium]